MGHPPGRLHLARAQPRGPSPLVGGRRAPHKGIEVVSFRCASQSARVWPLDSSGCIASKPCSLTMAGEQAMLTNV
eukprot:86396-Chlamydomonas_euryale.AAC.29